MGTDFLEAMFYGNWVGLCGMRLSGGYVMETGVGLEAMFYGNRSGFGRFLTTRVRNKK